MKHFSHDHSLRRTRYRSLNVICKMCQHLIPVGEYFYECDESYCTFSIHIRCADLPEHIDCHPLHPLHGLILTKRSSSNENSCFCYYCVKPLENIGEYVYACDNQLCSDFYMHMTCAVIPIPTMTTSNIDGAKDRVVQFSCHQKPMSLVDESLKCTERGAKCFGCQSHFSGPAYSCISHVCVNFLHKSCAELPQKIQHPFHPSHSLILQVSKPRSCRSCYKKDCRLIFNCSEDGCNFILCVECFSLHTRLQCQSHDHFLFLVEKSFCVKPCDVCQKSYEHEAEATPKEVIHTRSFMFQCMDCNFNLHFLCGPLPSTIIFENHIHPLFLSNHSISKDHSDEYYCDVCEEERDQSFRIYYCEECKYVAHIHCLIYEIYRQIMKLIKGDTKDVKLRALEEDRWDPLDIEPSSINQQSSESTLKDIMDRGLTAGEKEMLIDPFAFNVPSLKVFRRNVYNIFRQNSVYFDREGSIEDDIDKIQRIFHFGSGEYENFQSELNLFTPEGSLLNLDDQYLRQKVVNVDGYMVPKTLASVLKTFLRKYKSDFLQACEKKNISLTPAMKSIISTLLCIVIHRMYRINFEDITWDDLKQLHFCLIGIHKITGFTLPRYWDTLGDTMDACFASEAIRYEKDIREKLEAEMKKLKAEMKRCKENREKLKINTSNMSVAMRQCSRKASEWKQRLLGDECF